MIKVMIVNVVATASLKQKVDLPKIGKLPNVLYDPDLYGGRVAYIKSPTMKGKVTVFNSGKMISVGTTREEEATNDLQQVEDMLAEAGLIQPTSLEVTIQNIVATADFNIPIDIEKAVEKLHGIYEPEQFPGAIIKIHEPYKATILLFASGKAVIAGTKSLSQISSIVKMLSISLSLKQIAQK